MPGPSISANRVFLNALVQPSLGRPLSGGAANVTVNLVPPGTLFGDRLNQLDFRVGKVLRFGAKGRVTPSIDIFNVLNANAVLVESSNFNTFRQPQDVAQGRLELLSRGRPAVEEPVIRTWCAWKPRHRRILR